MARFKPLLAILLPVIGLALPGCRSGDAAQRAVTTRPVTGAASGDPLNSEQADGMAAEDVDALRLRPKPRQPQRPPPAEQRRPVDQPRIRGG